jgi:hypothetical protein
MDKKYKNYEKKKKIVSITEKKKLKKISFKRDQRAFYI